MCYLHLAAPRGAALFWKITKRDFPDGYTPTELRTEAAVTLDPEGQGFRITRSALTLRAAVPNLDEATFARMAGEAEKNCPVSKLLNAEITLDAKLM